jgi:acyl-CoA synthetase (NDP forming)
MSLNNQVFDDKNIKIQNEKVLKLISDKFNIQIDDLTEEVIKVFPYFVNINKIDYDENKCRAIVFDKIKHQCTRAYRIDNFCKLHHKMFENSNLKYGYINIEKPMFLNNLNDHKINSQELNKSSDITDNSEIALKIEEDSAIALKIEDEDINIKTEVQRIIINQKEYLINPFTSYLYDFSTKRNIGILDDEDNIISNYKKKLEKNNSK